MSTRPSNNFKFNHCLFSGSIIYICQPIGSIFSAITTGEYIFVRLRTFFECIRSFNLSLCANFSQNLDYFGRKWGMIIVNVPFAIAWFLMYQAKHVSHLFIANSLLGLSVGLMESPVMTYLGEISEPATRGILISYANLGTPLGGFVIFFLNTLTDWRTVGLICFAVPIGTVIALFFVPETPHWLIGKGRIERAEKALCWLR